jgi:hypothetical protein
MSDDSEEETQKDERCTNTASLAPDDKSDDTQTKII